MSIVVVGDIYGNARGFLNGTVNGRLVNGHIDEFGIISGQFRGDVKGNVKGYVSGYVFMYGNMRGNATNIAGTVNPLPEANQIVYGQPGTVSNINTYLNGYATVDAHIDGYLHNTQQITVKNIF
jgi:hypothetical protein